MRDLSTGQAAERLSVTADTILKWIKRGWIPATRTAGGHYRIAWQDVESRHNLEREETCPITAEREPCTFVHCWEFFSDEGSARDGCRKCLVFQAQAEKCYEISRLPKSYGFEGLFCTNSCENCSYYQSKWQQSSPSQT